ncbi:MAG TPA: DNA repair protein RecN [Myxococcota bacterium]|nr:DNA repair protein RecN [Myxococcota bacterium]
MLTRLAIHDFAIINELSVEFGPGFSVLTGETGAGKSIIVQSLHLLLGGRANSDMIRTGRDAAAVEGVFRVGPDSTVGRRLLQAGLSAEGTLEIRRLVSRAGRNQISLNGHQVSLAVLAEITRGLADISGQHRHVNLVDEQTQRQILDDFGNLGGPCAEVGKAVERLRSCEKRLTQIEKQERQREEREDYLRFTLDRIQALDPQPGEDKQLQRERERLRHSEKLTIGLAEVVALLYEEEGAVVELLGRAGSTLRELAAYDDELAPKRDATADLLRQVEELSRDVGSMATSIQADPGRLEEIEERLAAIKSLIRAHGPDLDALLESRAKIEAELASLDNLSARREELAEEFARSKEQAFRLAQELSARRLEVAGRLGAQLVGELRTLAMPDARVRIEVLSSDKLQEWGLDQVRLMLSANQGEDLRPLARVASGGELSRVLLALTAVLSRVDRVSCYVFDEVDSGVGGQVASVIGGKLAAVSAGRQVICITHLPQIAARANTHYAVSKRVVSRRTLSEIVRLSDKQRVEEIARMLGGSRVGDKARAAARELIGAKH